MKEKILILSDNSRGIAYKSILPFYELIVLTENALASEAMKDCVTAIIDMKDLERSIVVSNQIRKDLPSIPLLLINELSNPSDFLYFSKIQGYGQIRTLKYHAAFHNEILEYTQELIHPEYPVTRSDIAIIIPVYNEESRFHNVYDFIQNLKTLLRTSLINASIYFVNDGSKDNTSELIDKLMSDNQETMDYISNKSEISSYTLSYNTRKAGTFIEGIRSIHADIIAFVDADNSFVIDDIALMINIIKVGYYDMVVGTKDMTAENRPLVRRMVSFCKRLLTKPLLPKGIYDSQTGHKMINSIAAQNILPYLHENTGLAIDLEMLYIAKKLNFRVLQLPVTCIDREGSHVSLIKDSISFIKNIIKLMTVNRHIKIKK